MDMHMLFCANPKKWIFSSWNWNSILNLLSSFTCIVQSWRYHGKGVPWPYYKFLKWIFMSTWLHNTNERKERTQRMHCVVSSLLSSFNLCYAAMLIFNHQLTQATSSINYIHGWGSFIMTACFSVLCTSTCTGTLGTSILFIDIQHNQFSVDIYVYKGIRFQDRKY